MPPVISLLLSIASLLGAMPSVPQRATPRATTQSPHGTLNISCTNCHTFTAWKPIRSMPEFDHSKTRYPLRGMHTSVACMQCHTSLVFSNVGMNCASCHADFHHGQFGTNCEQCHTVKGWRVGLASIQEHQNRFPLLGAHATLQCEDCHKQAAAGRFAGLPTDCYSCHAKQFQTAASINHVASAFPPTCESCHNMDSWLGAKFDHARFTGFALTGMHATLECSACHINGKFKGTPADCYSCHVKDYNQTNNPNHIQAGFPRDCSSCHTTVSWANAKFNHASVFPLTGAHATLPCASCHLNNNVTGLGTTCVSCHLKDYNSTNNPNHKSAGFPTTCETCHTTSGWSPASFNHNSVFPLTGVHATLQCTQCHLNGNFSNTPADCASCHINDYNGTTNPNHKASGFPTDCSICHSTSGWIPSTFNHASVFALTGAHATLACTACHVNNNFTSLGTTCVSCHLKDYQGTTNPNHVSAGLPTDCAVCHTTTAWVPASFDHSTTGFPLTGAHATLACTACHIGGQFNGTTPTDCYSCHKTDYQNTTNPNHTAAAFPTTCALCHTTTTWAGATFNHTWFPIYSGTHAGKWTTCADCHVNSANYAVFSCITCHAHSDAASVTQEHQGVGNFVYSATSCYSCHPTGNGG